MLSKTTLTIPQKFLGTALVSTEVYDGGKEGTYLRLVIAHDGMEVDASFDFTELGELIAVLQRQAENVTALGEEEGI